MTHQSVVRLRFVMAQFSWSLLLNFNGGFFHSAFTSRQTVITLAVIVVYERTKSSKLAEISSFSSIRTVWLVWRRRLLETRFMPISFSSFHRRRNFSFRCNSILCNATCSSCARVCICAQIPDESHSAWHMLNGGTEMCIANNRRHLDFSLFEPSILHLNRRSW